MGYRIDFTSAATRQLEKLSRAVQKRLSPAIGALSDDPFPAGSKVLEGRRSCRRVRVGTYRIIYQVDDEAGVVLVVALGHRKDIYRLLPKL